MEDSKKIKVSIFVRPSVVRDLKSRAAFRGLTLSDYIEHLSTVAEDITKRMNHIVSDEQELTDKPDLLKGYSKCQYFKCISPGKKYKLQSNDSGENPYEKEMVLCSRHLAIAKEKGVDIQEV